jgi:cell division protein FtsN
VLKRDRSTGGGTRKRGRKKGSTRAKGAVLSNNLLFLVLGGLLMLTAGVYWVKQHGMNPVLPTRPKRALNKTLPPKPQERWHYIKALESKQITVIPPASSPFATGAAAVLPSIEKKPPLPPFKATQWQIQCEPCERLEQAQSLRASLALLGFEATIFKEGRRQRVVLGPYPQRAMAEKILYQLKQAQGPHCALVASYH